MKKSLTQNLIFVVAMVVSLFVIWLIASLLVNNTFLLPTPTMVLAELGTLLVKGSFYSSVFATLWRAVVAFAISLVVAFVLAVVINLFNVRKPVSVVVTLMRAMPTISIIFLCLVVFHSNTISIIVASLVAFPVIYEAFDSAINNGQQLNQMCDVFEVGKMARIRYIFLPLLSKPIYQQSRATLPLCIKIAVAGEALALPMEGIGRDMFIAKNAYDMAMLFAWTIVALVICYLLEASVWGIGKIISKVKGGNEQ
ncbi:MAG: hypothetical protein IJF66_01865 [Clostridia bacterium]|nr:hypothetical protein [Clostridia bacterium]